MVRFFLHVIWGMFLSIPSPVWGWQAAPAVNSPSVPYTYPQPQQPQMPPQQPQMWPQQPQMRPQQPQMHPPQPQVRPQQPQVRPQQPPMWPQQPQMRTQQPPMQPHPPHIYPQQPQMRSPRPPQMYTPQPQMYPQKPQAQLPQSGKVSAIKKKGAKGIAAPLKAKISQKVSGQGRPKKKESEGSVGPKSVPPQLRPLSKKTILIDARRLRDHKFTETIRYIKEHPDIRLKLQNMTIDPDSIVPLMKGFRDANVIDQIRDIGFVMLPGPRSNQVLNEQAFINKVLPYLGYLEGIELSCLGVSDTVINVFAKRMPHLKYISLFGVGVTDAAIKSLAKGFPNLVKIYLTNTSVTNKGIQDLAEKFPYLRALGVSGQNLKDKDFDALKEGAFNLHSFSAIGQTFKDTATVSRLLEGMPKLHTLNLSETNVTDQVVRSIPATVKNLDISDTPITYEGVKDIANRLDLTTLKMNNLKNIGGNELDAIIESQPGLKKFYCAGVYLNDATVMKLILKLTNLIDVTLIPAADSKWVLSEPIAEALALKKVKLQYLRIPADRLTEALRFKLQKKIPNLRIEYER